MSELTIDQLERIASEETRVDYARRRRETEADMRLCDELEDDDVDRSVDSLEVALSGWKDDVGFPLPGFESPRFGSARKSAYYNWILSEARERTRRNMHAKLEDRISRGAW